MYSDINEMQICLNEPPQNPLHRDVLLICDCVFCDYVFFECVFCDCVFMTVCLMTVWFVTVWFVTVWFMTMCFVTVFCDSVLSSILFNKPGLLTEILLFRSVIEFSLRWQHSHRCLYAFC